MEVLRYLSASEFLTATESFRKSDPIRTGLITSIANSVASGSRTYEGYFWWAVIGDGEVKGIAIRTLPFGYVFSPMALVVAKNLFEKIRVEDPSANEFAGPRDVIDYLETIAQILVQESESELIYENRELIPSLKIGTVRLATHADFDLVFQWMGEFINETGLRDFNLEGIVRGALQENRYYLLIVDEVPVSLGGRSPIQSFDGFSIGRVGPIYTPRMYRKNGYASAVTSEITQILIGEGAMPTLYTQAENPTSNKIYQDLGYSFVAENRRILFSTLNE